LRIPLPAGQLREAWGEDFGGQLLAYAALAAYGVGIEVSADGGIEGFRRTATATEGAGGRTRKSFRLMK
jgi:hypothetical protein